MTDDFVPRPKQKDILAYSGGPMGISAVPGSGKTFTLSLLAADLVERLTLDGRLDDREVLVVTFTNSAVENFRNRIAAFLHKERGLLPGVGYRVRTLHGLAHDIVRERPSLVGLSEDFDIIDERTAGGIIRDLAGAYVRQNPDAFSPYIQPTFLQNLGRIERRLTEDVVEIANAIIRTIKDQRIPLRRLQEDLRLQSGTWPMLEYGLQLFADYQRSLEYRGAVDFDDLIVFALQALEADPGYLDRLQQRWPYVLEDEAQDSSGLQEKMLCTLTAGHGNWVRVGDPNQAINTTFTSADTSNLRRFIETHREHSRDLPNSGRSAQPIIDIANRMIDWSRTEHPILSAGEALSTPHILPAPPGDPQPNPAAGELAVFLWKRALSPSQEVDVVVASLRRWLPDNQDHTVAVLAPMNHRSEQVIDALDAAGLPCDDSLMRAGSATRAAAKSLATLLAYLARPHTATDLEHVWTDVWWPHKGEMMDSTDGGATDRESAETSGRPRRRLNVDLPEPVATFGRALSRIREPESFLFPAESDWLDSLSWLDEVNGFRDIVEAFRADLRRWVQAIVLPIEELLLTLGNELFSEPADVALTHYLAVLLAKLAHENPSWRIPELASELDSIALNRRRMADFSGEESGFEAKPGVVTVATMHGAKGLEWDRVYLMAVNNYSFPSGSDEERYRGEPFYARDRLNLVAEATEQLRYLNMGSLDGYEPGPATHQARIDLAAERLRLLYVGITRARRELIVTYNTGRNPQRDPNQPALVFEVLNNMSVGTT